MKRLTLVTVLVALAPVVARAQSDATGQPLPATPANAATPQAPANQGSPQAPADPRAPAPPASKLSIAIEALRRQDAVAALQAAREAVQDAPASAAAREVLGAAALLSQRWAEADAALREAVRLEPGRATAIVMLGQLALAGKDPRRAEMYFRHALAITPDVAAVHRHLAVALLQQGRGAEAIPAAQESLRLSQGKDVEARYFLAGVYQELGRHRDAERELESVLKQSPAAPAPRLSMGFVKVDLGETDEAAAIFKQVLEREPGTPAARLGLSVIDRIEGRLAQARAVQEELTSEKPSWAQAHYQLGLTLLAQLTPDRAVQAFERAATLAPEPGVIRLQAAQALLLGGDVDHAIAEARRARGSTMTADAARALLVQAYAAKGRPELAEEELKNHASFVELGRFYLGQKRFADALTAFEAALDEHREGTEALVGRAEALAGLGRAADAMKTAEYVVSLQRETPDSFVFLGLIQESLGRFADAEATYRRVLDRHPAHLSAARALAALLVRQNRAADAVDLLRRASEANRDSAAPLVDLADLYRQSGNTAGVTAAFRRALARDSNNPVLLNDLAFELGKDGADLDEALPLAERAHRLAPRSPAIADTLGWLLYHAGDLDRSEVFLTQAARALPHNADVHYHLGRLYASRGRAAEARREIEKALEAPTFRAAAQAREVLTTLPK